MKKILVLISLLLVVWTFFIEPNMLCVNTMNLEIKGLEGLKIVFVGDFHVKPHQGKRLKNIVKMIEKQNPDLILSTGDFVSGHSEKQSMQIEEIAEELSFLKPKYGFYAVLGNHDWWQGGEKIAKVLEKNRIVILANENKAIDINGKKLYIAGVEDLMTRNIDLVKALKNTHHPTILLTHSPDVFPFVADESNSKITGKVDLTLAGHTHGGQVSIPFVGPPVVSSDYGKKYAKGLVEEKGKKIFITKGIGTSILPVRFNCVPEIVVINFN